MASTQKVTWPFKQVVTLGHLTNLIDHISCRPMTMKQSKVMTCRERIKPLKPLDVTSATWQIDQFIYSLSQDLWLLNLAGCWLQGLRTQTHKVSPSPTWCFDIRNWNYSVITEIRMNTCQWQNTSELIEESKFSIRSAVTKWF